MNKRGTVEISFDELKVINDTHTFIFSIKELDATLETGNYFYCKLISGIMIIIPKQKIQNTDEVRSLLKEIASQQQKPYTEMLEWKW